MPAPSRAWLFLMALSVRVSAPLPLTFTPPPLPVVRPFWRVTFSSVSSPLRRSISRCALAPSIVSPFAPPSMLRLEAIGGRSAVSVTVPLAFSVSAPSPPAVQPPTDRLLSADRMALGSEQVALTLMVAAASVSTAPISQAPSGRGKPRLSRLLTWAQCSRTPPSSAGLPLSSGKWGSKPCIGASLGSPLCAGEQVLSSITLPLLPSRLPAQSPPAALPAMMLL